MSLALAALLALASCMPPPQPPAERPAEAPTQAPVEERPAVYAIRQMVAAANPLAAEAGREILRTGGSAVDAAIATQMVLNLVEPQSSGIGGGGFLMHFDARTGAITAYDGRETAPAAATPDMFLRPDGTPMGFSEAVVGGLSVGVPGLLRMLEQAHKDHGRLPWASLFAPAIRLTENGFAMSPRLHRQITRDKYLRTFPEAAAYFYEPDGRPKPVGTRLRNPAFARTLHAIAEGGADAFYEGDIARDIAAAVQTVSKNPGRLSAEDIAAYRAKVRDPVCLPYRAWLVCGMPPPSSGGVTTLEILGMLEHFDLGELEPGSLQAVHLIAEASRLAYADRGAFLADGDFVSVPVQDLLDPGYLARRAKLISPERSLGKAEPGLPRLRADRGPAPTPTHEGASTTHISIVDEDGSVVALTSSIEQAFGSRLMVRGFMLNNELTDFSFRPERGGRPVANRAEPGKRPRSTMAPTLVFDGRGRPVLAVGSPGGSRIVDYVVKTLIAVLDWNLDIQEAISFPNFVNRNGPTELEKGTRLEALVPALEKLGHEVRIRPLVSGIQGIAMQVGVLVGGADPRREGAALGD